jgi:hypothetical protein
MSSLYTCYTCSGSLVTREREELKEGVDWVETTPGYIYTAHIVPVSRAGQAKKQSMWISTFPASPCYHGHVAFSSFCCSDGHRCTLSLKKQKNKEEYSNETTVTWTTNEFLSILRRNVPLCSIYSLQQLANYTQTQMEHTTNKRSGGVCGPVTNMGGWIQNDEVTQSWIAGTNNIANQMPIS